MIRAASTRVALTLAATVFIAVATPLSGQLLGNADSGVSERLFGRNAKIGTDNLAFIWEPALTMSQASYALVVLCNRRDNDGDFVGSHTATFKAVELGGLQSQNRITITSKIKVRIKQGLPTRVGVVDLTPAIQQAFQTDPAVLVMGRVTMTKKANRGDLVLCGMSVVELDDALVAAKGEGERLEAFREFSGRVSSLPRH